MKKLLAVGALAISFLVATGCAQQDVKLSDYLFDGKIYSPVYNKDGKLIEYQEHTVDKGGDKDGEVRTVSIEFAENERKKQKP